MTDDLDKDIQDIAADLAKQCEKYFKNHNVYAMDYSINCLRERNVVYGHKFSIEFIVLKKDIRITKEKYDELRKSKDNCEISNYL